MLLVPYWSGQPGVFEGFLSNPSRDHRIVTWDARGTGDSTHEGPYDVETDSTPDLIASRIRELVALTRV